MAKSFKEVMKEKAERAEQESRPKLEWFSLKNGETKYVRFLQELDTDMRNYDSNLGTAVFLTEHVSPYDWSRKAICTMDDEGRCFACEMVKEEPKIVDEEGKDRWGVWKPKTNFYIYTVNEKGEVRVLSRPTSNRVFDALTEEVEENNNSLTDITFKISKGPNKSDSWEVRKWSKAHFELPEIPELVDLNTAVGRKVEYVEQRNFYLPATKDAPATTEERSEAVGENW